jgi:hypothetical protein
MSWKRIYSDALKGNQKNIEGISKSVIGRFAWRDNNKHFEVIFMKKLELYRDIFLKWLKFQLYAQNMQEESQ